MNMEQNVEQEDGRYFRLPQPAEISERDREDAMGAYLMMFAAVAVALPLPVINLIAAIVYHFVNRRKSRFIHFHSLQSLLSQLPTTLMSWGLLVWGVRVFFLKVDEVNDYFIGYAIAWAVAMVVYVVFSIVAAVKARNGRMYYFIFFGRLSYQMIFSKHSKFRYQNEPEPELSNQPPA